MIRILYDEVGDSHMDLFVKVSSMPTFLEVADSYFLADFLGDRQGTKDRIVLDYIEYFIQKVQQLSDRETFIPFDLSDQYVGGFFMSKRKNGLIDVQYAFNTAMNGYAMHVDNADEQVKEFRADFQVKKSWQLSLENVLKGLDWSLKRILISTDQ